MIDSYIYNLDSTFVSVRHLNFFRLETAFMIFYFISSFSLAGPCVEKWKSSFELLGFI